MVLSPARQVPQEGSFLLRRAVGAVVRHTCLLRAAESLAAGGWFWGMARAPRPRCQGATHRTEHGITTRTARDATHRAPPVWAPDTAATGTSVVWRARTRRPLALL